MLNPLDIESARYIAANLRDRDRREMLAVLPDGMDLELWVDAMFENPVADRWVIRWGDEPVAMCGVTPTPLRHLAQSWAVGTEKKLLAGAAMMKTAMEAHRLWIAKGVRRFSCLCLDSPEESSEWLVRLGYQYEGLLRGFGRNGEDFIQWGALYGD